MLNSLAASNCCFSLQTVENDYWQFHDNQPKCSKISITVGTRHIMLLQISLGRLKGCCPFSHKIKGRGHKNLLGYAPDPLVCISQSFVWIRPCLLVCLQIFELLSQCSRLLYARVDPSILIGFNNTGNICE